MKSFEINGYAEDRLKRIGPISLFACIALCVSTATISDGGDMNWTVHTVGATSFFILSVYMALVASKIYRELYSKQKFIGEISYQIKRYSVEIVGFHLAGTSLVQNPQFCMCPSKPKY